MLDINPIQDILYKRIYDPTTNRVYLQYVIGYRNGIPVVRTFFIYTS